VHERHDAIVIGAGLAGLTAAHALQAQGLDVLVLEAQERVGGRVHSMRQLGGVGEAGGTYIGAGYARVIAAANRFNIRLVDVTPVLEFFREQDLVLDGKIIRQADWPEHPANPFPGADKQFYPWTYHRVLTMRSNPLAAPEDWLGGAHAGLDVSMHAWLASLGLSERAVALAYGMNLSFGSDAHDVSALLLLFRAAFSKAQRSHASADQIGFTAERGVQRIPEAMAEHLRRHVALGRAVASVHLSRDGAQVTCVDGARLAARHVVAAIPFGALRRIAIDPPLTGTQAQAVRELPAQPITQVYLAPKTPFWEKDGYAPSLFTDSLAGMLAAARHGDDPRQVTSLTAWIMGEAAASLDGLPAAEIGRRVIADIERIRPAARGQLELLGACSWGADPYAAGAWAYFRPGQVTAWAATMGRAHGRLHFCGEHLAIASRGMEGAMESGERAASEILAEI
jgi:monoamine oxidase